MHSNCLIAVVGEILVDLKTDGESCSIGHTAHGMIVLSGVNVKCADVDVLSS